MYFVKPWQQIWYERFFASVVFQARARLYLFVYQWDSVMK
jgi:hypothetical protein